MLFAKECSHFSSYFIPHNHSFETQNSCNKGRNTTQIERAKMLLLTLYQDYLQLSLRSTFIWTISNYLLVSSRRLSRRCFMWFRVINEGRNGITTVVVAGAPMMKG
jgi:hypothetical protein